MDGHSGGGLHKWLSIDLHAGSGGKVRKEGAGRSLEKKRSRGRGVGVVQPWGGALPLRGTAASWRRLPRGSGSFLEGPKGPAAQRARHAPLCLHQLACMGRCALVAIVTSRPWPSRTARASPTCSWPRCQEPYTATSCACQQGVGGTGSHGGHMGVTWRGEAQGHMGSGGGGRVRMAVSRSKAYA